MGKKDQRVDAYIARAEPFARPILAHMRKIVHQAVPGVEETMKWSFPHFDYSGMMCSMASFKEHCTFGFWKAKLMSDPHGVLGRTAMGHFGRIRSIGDLPPAKVFSAYVREAARLNADGVKLPARPKAVRKAPAVPSYFMAALRKSRKALATFQAFSPSNKRDYVEWVTEAKTEDTRRRRLETAVEWMAQGKPRNWKYMKK